MNLDDINSSPLGSKGVKAKRSKGNQQSIDEDSISIINQIKSKNNQNNNNQYYFKKSEWRRSGNLKFVLKLYLIIVAQDPILPDIKKTKHLSPKIRGISEIKNPPLKKQISLQKFPIKNKKPFNLRSIDTNSGVKSSSLSERSSSTEATTNSNNSSFLFY